jgi:ppGpp synthetase/RelA/SpoT-type nucleotidyltranferase
MENNIISDTIDFRQKYQTKKDKYERFLGLVTLIINSAIKKRKIKVHSFKSRVKDYNSFLEKVERKQYKKPFRECTDLAGCRIVCLFLSQVNEIEKIVRDEFEILEITDKKSSKKYDQFGYLSLHMLVKIPKKRLKFIEYEELSDFVGEIQIRTILQEAWAEIEHYLNYKATKEERNELLLRKIFSLAGMFEVADSTFEEINSGFSKMVKEKVKITEGTITALNLYKLSRGYFASFNEDWDKNQERKFYKLSTEIQKLNLHKILQLKSILDRYKFEIKKYFVAKKDQKIAPSEVIRVALALEYGHKYDLIFGLKGYSDKIKKEINGPEYRKF